MDNYFISLELIVCYEATVWPIEDAVNVYAALDNLSDEENQ